MIGAHMAAALAHQDKDKVTITTDTKVLCKNKIFKAGLEHEFDCDSDTKHLVVGVLGPSGEVEEQLEPGKTITIMKYNGKYIMTQ